MSDDRAHETEDRLEQADAPRSAATVRRERSSSRSSRVQGISTGQDSGTGSKSQPAKGHPTRARGAADTKVAIPARLMRFLREVVAELAKVIWPTRRELVVYTAVVLVFVSFMVAFVSLLDMGLGRAVLSVFG